MNWPAADEACPNMMTRYCYWECMGTCYRFPYRPARPAEPDLCLVLVLLPDHPLTPPRGIATGFCCHPLPCPDHPHEP